VIPLMARMLYCLFRGAVALLAAVAVGYMFGFRMFGGFIYAAAFAVLVLMLTLALSLAADAAGVLSVNWRGGIAGSGAFTQFLLVPQNAAGNAVHRDGASRLVSGLAAFVRTETSLFRR